MKTIKTCAAALLVLSLAACKKDKTVTPEQEVSSKNKVDTNINIGKINNKTPVADTVIISKGCIVVKNITWIFPWYNALEVKNIHSYISEGTPIRVFVKRDNNSTWMEATPVANDGSGGDYEYFIEKRLDGGGAGMYNYGSLYVFYYGFDTSDTPDVKVQF